MATNKKVKDITAKTTVADTDEVYINDVAGGNVDKKMTRANFIGSAAIDMNNFNIKRINQAHIGIIKAQDDSATNFNM